LAVWLGLAVAAGVVVAAGVLESEGGEAVVLDPDGVPLGADDAAVELGDEFRDEEGREVATADVAGVEDGVAADVAWPVVASTVSSPVSAPVAADVADGVFAGLAPPLVGVDAGSDIFVPALAVFFVLPCVVGMAATGVGDSAFADAAAFGE
jgi:hypothetical protein